MTSQNGGQEPQKETLPLLNREVHEGKECAVLNDGLLDSAARAPAHTPANVFLTDGTNLQSLSDGASRWRAERHLMWAWCITSVVALLFGGIEAFTPSTVSTMIGTVCSVWFLCRVNQLTPARDAAANVQVVYWLAIVAAVLSGLWTICMLATSIFILSAPLDSLDKLDKRFTDDNRLQMDVTALLICGSLLAHTVTSSLVAHRARMINRQMSACSILV